MLFSSVIIYHPLEPFFRPGEPQAQQEILAENFERRYH